MCRTSNSRTFLRRATCLVCKGTREDENQVNLLVSKKKKIKSLPDNLEIALFQFVLLIYFDSKEKGWKQIWFSHNFCLTFFILVALLGRVVLKRSEKKFCDHDKIMINTLKVWFLFFPSNFYSRSTWEPATETKVMLKINIQLCILLRTISKCCSSLITKKTWGCMEEK